MWSVPIGASERRTDAAVSQRDAAVIVVGAAVAGGAVANALGMLGVDTLVLEKGFERENSARGDFLHPPTLRFLERWGVLDGLSRGRGAADRYLAVSHRTLGRLATYDVRAQGEGPAGRTIAVPHDRIEAVMKETAETRPNVRSQRATVDRAAARGRAGGRGAGAARGRGSRAAGPLVVGCDGGMSLVRRELGIESDRTSTTTITSTSRPTGGPTRPPRSTSPGRVRDHPDRLAAESRMRIAIYFERADPRRPAAALGAEIYDYVVYRVPWLEGIRFTRDDVSSIR